MRICCGIPAATPWPIVATTRGILRTGYAPWSDDPGPVADAKAIEKQMEEKGLLKKGSLSASRDRQRVTA
jgi:hypothetical protein